MRFRSFFSFIRLPAVFKVSSKRGFAGLVLFSVLVVEIILAACYGVLPLEPLPKGFKEFYSDVFKPKYVSFKHKGSNKMFVAAVKKDAFVIESPKPAGVYRVIILGGSVIAAFATCPELVAHIKRMCPDKKVEIVNLAFGGYDSYRVGIMAREVAAYEPDTVIIGAGNNEMFSSGRFRPEFFLLLRYLRVSRVFRFIGNSIKKVSVPPLLTSEKRYEFFRKNIENSVVFLQQKGINVVLCTLNANQRHWLPSNEDIFADNKLLLAKLLLYAGKLTQFWDAIKQLDPHTAKTGDALYLKAKAHDLQGNILKAAALYKRAKDLSSKRVSSKNNQIIRKIAGKYNLVLVDLSKLIEAASPDGIPGVEFYYDQCHFFLSRRAFFMDFFGRIFWENRKKLGLFNSEVKDLFFPKAHTVSWNTDLLREYKKTKLPFFIRSFFSPENYASTNRFAFDLFLIIQPEVFIQDIEQAWETFKKKNPSMVSNQSAAVLFSCVGAALLRSGQWKQAAVMFERSFAFTPDLRVFLQLVCCRFMLGDRNDIEQLLQRAKKLCPADDNRQAALIGMCRYAFDKLETVYGFGVGVDNGHGGRGGGTFVKSDKHAA